MQYGSHINKNITFVKIWTDSIWSNKYQWSMREGSSGRIKLIIVLLGSVYKILPRRVAVLYHAIIPLTPHM